MEFMKWLSSLDELLYEVMSWLVFYPLTLWRAVSRPLYMMGYADRQLELPEDERYADALSPPLFLTLSLLLVHGVSVAFGEVDSLVASRRGLSALVDDQLSALAVRVLAFALFPLVMAVRTVRRRGAAVDRRSLRWPFYAHCYPGTVFAGGASLGGTVAFSGWTPGGAVGGTLVAAALLFYLGVLTRWYAVQFALSPIRSAAIAASSTVMATALLLAGGALLVL